MTCRLAIALVGAAVLVAGPGGPQGVAAPPHARAAGGCTGVDDTGGCVVWFGLARHLSAKCRPGCPARGITPRQKVLPFYLFVTPDGRKIQRGAVVTSNLQPPAGRVRRFAFECENDWEVADTPAKVDSAGRFVGRDDFRNPQSGDVFKKDYSGRFVGEDVTGKSTAMVAFHASGNFCDGAYRFSAVRTSLHGVEPVWWPGHYSGQASGATVDFATAGDRITSFHVTAPLQCDDGSTYQYDYSAPAALTLQSPFGSQGTASAEVSSSDTEGYLDVSVRLESGGKATVPIQGTVKPRPDVSCSPTSDSLEVTARNPLAS